MNSPVFLLYEGHVVYCVCSTLDEAKRVAMAELPDDEPIVIEGWHMDRPFGDWGRLVYIGDGKWQDVDTGAVK